jgi:hypothetical protein
MIHRMAAENVTQFGKERFAVYKEVVTAGAKHIMAEVLAGRGDGLNLEYAPGYTAGDYNAGELKQKIIDGDCPGYRTINRFFGGILDKNDILLALEAFRETGELAEWHKAHNPLAKPKAQPQPTLDAEALRQFERPEHVRTFVKAVRDTRMPVPLQREVAEGVVTVLSSQPHRFNSANIRKQVIEDAARRERGPKRQAELKRMEQLSTLERAMIDFDAGLKRTIYGCQHIEKIIEAMGGITATDMTMTLMHHLREARASIAALDRYLGKKTFRKTLGLPGGR